MIFRKVKYIIWRLTTEERRKKTQGRILVEDEQQNPDGLQGCRLY
jgi:hypothetical protein